MSQGINRLILYCTGEIVTYCVRIVLLVLVRAVLIVLWFTHSLFALTVVLTYLSAHTVLYEIHPCNLVVIHFSSGNSHTAALTFVYVCSHVSQGIKRLILYILYVQFVLLGLVHVLTLVVQNLHDFTLTTVFIPPAVLTSVY